LKSIVEGTPFGYQGISRFPRLVDQLMTLSDDKTPINLLPSVAPQKISAN